MKIIKIDGLNRESYNYPDVLIASCPDEKMAYLICDLLRDKLGCDENWFNVEKDDYELETYEP